MITHEETMTDIDYIKKYLNDILARKERNPEAWARWLKESEEKVKG